MPDEKLAKLRDRSITMYAVLESNPVTKPAAFGVAARIIQDDAGCDLLAAIMLLQYWIEQTFPEEHFKNS